MIRKLKRNLKQVWDKGWRNRLPVLLVVVVLGATVGAFYVQYYKNNSTLVASIAGGALTWITAAYVYQTWKIAQGTRLQAEQNVRPIVKLDIGTAFSSGQSRVYLKCSNQGAGPAINLRAWVELEESGSGKTQVLNTGKAMSDTQGTKLFPLYENFLSVGQRFADLQTHQVSWVPTWAVVVPFDAAQVAAFRVHCVYQGLSVNWFVSSTYAKKVDENIFSVEDFSCWSLSKDEALKMLKAAGFQMNELEEPT